MDLELQKGFNELQYQAIDTRNKINEYQVAMKATSRDISTNASIIEEIEKGKDKGGRDHYYVLVGRMVVKKEGDQALKYLQDREKQFKEKIKNLDEAQNVCRNRLKESEESLRELVNKKLNKSQEEKSQKEIDKPNPDSK